MTFARAVRHGVTSTRDWVRDLVDELLAALGELYR